MDDAFELERLHRFDRSNARDSNDFLERYTSRSSPSTTVEVGLRVFAEGDGDVVKQDLSTR